MKEWEEWIIVPQGGDKVAVKSRWNKYLSGSGISLIKQANSIKNKEVWTLRTINGKYVFTTPQKTNIRAGAKGVVNLTKVLDAWEQWTIIPKRR